MKILALLFVPIALLGTNCFAEAGNCKPFYMIIEAEDMQDASNDCVRLCRNECRQRSGGQTNCQPDRYDSKFTPEKGYYNAHHPMDSTSDGVPPKEIPADKDPLQTNPVKIGVKYYFEYYCACSTNPSVYDPMQY